MRAGADPQARSARRRKELPASPVTLQRDVPYELVYYLRENQQRLPRRLGRARLRAPLPAGQRSPPTSSATSARSTPSSSRTRSYEGLEPGDHGRPGRASSTPTTAAARQSTAPPGSRSTRSAARPASRSPTREPRTGNNLVLTIDADVQAAGEAAIGQLRAARRLRRDGRRHRRDPRARLEPDLRPVGLRQAARSRRRPYNGARPRGHRRAAVEPRDPGPLSDRLDLQADHRAGGARRGRAQPRARSSTTPASSRSATAACFQNAGDAVNGADRPARRAPGLLRRLLLQARPRMRTPTQATAGRSRTGRGRSGSASRPGSTSAARAPAAADAEAQRLRANTARLALRRRGLHRQGRVTDRPWTRRRQRQPRGRPGRPAGRPAADGGRLRGDRQRRRRRRARTSRMRVEDPTGPRDPGDRPGAARATSTSIPPARETILDGLHGAAMEPGGTSYPVFGGYPVDDRRQDRNRGAPGRRRPVLVHRAGAVPTTPKSWSR